MNNVFDYAKKYGDIPFNKTDLNEIDNVIFSRLSYLDLSEYVGKTLKEVSAVFPYTAEEEVNRRNKTLVLTEDLLKLIADSERFGSVLITNFEEIAGGSYETAFCAVTFKLTNDISYISYRGTDDQILSFYEDAELAYTFPVKAQLAALAYTNHAFDSQSGSFYLGGHSKGGNLAIFAYIFTKYENRDRTVAVYNNDGPGFPKDLVGVLFTPSNSEKIINLAPEGSIIGRMLEAGGKYTIVKSNAVSIAQHNVFTWVTDGDRFERMEKFSIMSEYMDNTLTESLNTLSPEDLKKAVQSIYKIAQQSGINTIGDINKKNYVFMLLAILEAVRSDQNANNEMKDIVKTLGRQLIDSLDITKLLPELDLKTIKEIIELRKKQENEDE